MTATARASAKNPYHVLEIINKAGEHEVFHSKEPIFKNGDLVIGTFHRRQKHGVVIKPVTWPARGATIVTGYHVRDENGREARWNLIGLLRMEVQSAEVPV